MFSSFFDQLTQIDSIFWGYVGFILIMLLGSYLTFKMRFFQIRSLPSIAKIFCDFLIFRSAASRGIHPIRAFFASVGGMIGIGNVVGIVTAIQIGGPGALFWVWVTALIGSLIKYSEVYLGVTHRVANLRGGYDGGPIYFLKSAFKNRWIPTIVAILLCIYGVEIYQFTIITDTLSSTWHLDKYTTIALLLGLVLYAGAGGVKRIGTICSCVMPFFIIAYLSLGIWVIVQEIHSLPAALQTVFQSAFAGHAALGGFVGSSLLLTIQHGISRAAYSADLGIGYDSIIQSESSTVYPDKQASLALFGVFIDSAICTMTILITLLSGLWTANPPIAAATLIQTALSHYFPFMDFFLPLFILCVGYSTIIAYFGVGMKCARFLAPRYGEKIYSLYAIFSFLFFSFFDPSKALLVMSLSGALLLCINLVGIFRLRDQISLPKVKEELLQPVQVFLQDK